MAMAKRCSPNATGSASVVPLQQIIINKQPQPQLSTTAMRRGSNFVQSIYGSTNLLPLKSDILKNCSTEDVCQNRKCVRTRDDLNKKCSEVRSLRVTIKETSNDKERYMRLMRLKEEEVRLKKKEIERLIIDYGRLEQQIKVLQDTLKSREKEEENMKMLHDKFDKLAAQIPLKDDYRKIMDKVDKVAQLEAKIHELEGQYEICFRRLEDDNATLQCTIQQYEDELGYLETENAELKEKLSDLINSAVCQRRDCVTREQKMKDQEKILHSPECTRPQCVQREQLIREQQKEHLSAECTKPRMFSAMKEMTMQYEGQHDQLKKEYNELMTNPNLPAMLGQLEKIFTDPFDAKVVLTKILMVSYEECKRTVIQSVAQHIEQLFTVQTESDEEESGEPSDVDMEDLSRAYGLLLQATSLKSGVAYTTALQDICGKIKYELKKEEQLQSKTAEKKLKKLPLEQIVELTWKFVTQNNPLIVCQPEMFDEDIQERDYHHWKPKLQKPYTLIYARPVLYRSYHGNIAGTGLVGNIPCK